MLYRALHLVAAAGYAAWQGGGGALSASYARSSLRALWQGGAAGGVQALAAIRRDVRALGAGGVCAAEVDGAEVERWQATKWDGSYSLTKVMDCFGLAVLNGSVIPKMSGGPLRRISGIIFKLFFATAYFGSIFSACLKASSASS